MDSVTDTPENIEELSRINPIRLAWGITLIAFAVFCLIFVTSVLGVHYFFFQSSRSLEATLYVGRGTVGVKTPNGVEQAETDERALSSGTIVRTDQTDLLSQAVITLRDPNYDNSLVASITLMGGSSVRLRSTSRPRFRWSSTNYHGVLEASGKMDVLIADGLNHDVQIIIYISTGAEVRLETSGRYGIDVSDTLVRVMSYRGQAILVAANRLNTQSISEGQQGELNLQSDVIELAPTLVNLVTNSDLLPFESTTPGEAGNTPTGLIGWSCTNSPPGNLPTGDYRADVSPDGRPSLRFVRAGGADTNGRTICEQHFDEGLDVRMYSYLSIRAVVYIHYQSLNRCGTRGSECPLMVKIQYIDENYAANHQEGEEPPYWIQGIYVRDDPGSDYPLRCDSCLSNNIRIYDDVWYIYQSDNLFTLYLPERRPITITDVIFYTEGHQYDVFIDEVALLAGQILPGASDGN